ncbi:diguanylate cyclase [Spongiibacter sp. KMU-166]|uniref:diguanylate cyclase n=1 Tax=Spongiibacter thalassae TaxID=2721624 RepID=A0ABX1G9I6_9GAMM|nr:diguanylate cyclase [Spongiibacter thalassae]NKI15809.1 diguanylate cyclase [Spongiibacter thalassae]
MTSATDRQSILIVEDDQLSAVLMATLLADLYTTHHANSGEQAMAMLGEVQPDLVLLDAMMPGLDGYQVLKEIKRHENLADIPIIFITGDNSLDAEIRALEGGAVDFVPKPYDPKVVRARVHLHLELLSKTRALQAANATLLHLSRSDPLTELANRRHFYEVAIAAHADAREKAQPLSLMVIDIDHFKSINDHYGHAAGDAVLTEFSAFARKFMRSKDCLARIGGEEFACLLPDSSAEQSAAIAERFRQSASELQLTPATGLNIKLTVSCGVTEFQHGDNGVDRALMRADQALYRAKREGRNCVRIAHQSDSEAAEFLS